MGTMRLAVAAGLLAATLAGCGSGISGDYGGDDCAIFQKLSFRKNGALFVTAMGTEIGGKYKVDGDKVTLIVEGESGVVLTRKGNTLEGSVLGQTFTCKKL